MEYGEQIRFVEEFNRRTNGAYDMIKFSGASYSKQDKLLTVRFIINAFDAKKLDEEKKKAINEVISQMFDGVVVNVQYMRTYADEGVVRNKILEFFNANNQLIFRRLSDNTLSCEVENGRIAVKLMFEPSTCKMLEAGDYRNRLGDFLSRTFTEDVSVRIVESEESDFDESEEEESFANTVSRGTSLRLIDARCGEKLYSRGKIEGISQMPNYIADVNGPADNAVLCGRATGISRRTYKNKKYNPDDPKTGPELLPIVSFYLNDTTGKIEAVCFPKPEEAGAFDSLNESDEVMCVGKASLSQYTGNLSYAVNAVFRCSIDFDSIKTDMHKPEPERYTTVFPEPYKSMRQTSLLEDRTRVPEYMKGKTFVVFDLETTSKSPAIAEITEIGAIKIENGVETNSFSTLVRPSSPIPPEITEITHITNEMVENAPTIDKVMPDFYKFTRGAILVGHNIDGYDFPIIKRVADILGYAFNNDTFDTLDKARRLLRNLRSYKLVDLSDEFNFTHTDAHRALSDVEATSELLFLLADKMSPSK